MIVSLTVVTKERKIIPVVSIHSSMWELDLSIYLYLSINNLWQMSITGCCPLTRFLNHSPYNSSPRLNNYSSEYILSECAIFRTGAVITHSGVSVSKPKRLDGRQQKAAALTLNLSEWQLFWQYKAVRKNSNSRQREFLFCLAVYCCSEDGASTVRRGVPPYAGTNLFICAWIWHLSQHLIHIRDR